MILSDRAFARVIGLQQSREQLRALPQAVREAFLIAAESTAKLIALRARATAPIRKEKVPGYAGGALRNQIDYEVDKAGTTAMVGIKRGVIVVTRQGRQVSVTRLRRFTRERYSRGRRRWVKEGHAALLRLAERDRIRANGGRIIQPSKYGHFAEYGRGGPRRGAIVQKFMEPAVRQSEDYFLRQMREGAKSVEADLRARGYNPGSLTRIYGGV